MKQHFIKEYVEFISNSPTPYHVTANCIQILEHMNYKRIKTVPTSPGKYYMKFNKTFLLVLSIPNAPKTIKIVAAHNDSPVLKIKNNGLNSDLLNLKPYGGGLWHTWFDRPLGIAGQVIDKNLKSHLVDIKRGVAYIPSLAVHLDSEGMYKGGFKYDKEKHLNAICQFSSVKELIDFENNNESAKNETKESNLEKEKINNNQGNKKSVNNEKGGKETTQEEIQYISHDLSLYDIQGAIIGGNNNEFVFSPRQDNLLSTFCAIKGLTECEDSINVAAIFDAEEVGSQTISGARTRLFVDAINKLIEYFALDISKSMIISADVAHGLNPNYQEKYEKNHSPKLGDGVVIKFSNYYATNCFTSAVIKTILSKYQEFVLRNDCLGGGTIGPMLCVGTGIQGVDIGVPVLGMHSIKEMSHIDDILDCYELFKTFYEKQLFNKK